MQREAAVLAAERDSDKVCRSTRLSKRAARRVREARQSASFQFANSDVALGPPLRLLPDDVYRVAMGREPDPVIRPRTERLLAEARQLWETGESFPASGFIYAFHDTANSNRTLKIGRTTQEPEDRLAQWERTLSPEQGDSLYLLFAYRALDNVLAEAVVHETLRCERLHNLVNPLTNDELTEFFTIENALAAQILVRQVLADVNTFVDEWLQWYRQSQLLID